MGNPVGLKIGGSHIYEQSRGYSKEGDDLPKNVDDRMDQKKDSTSMFWPVSPAVYKLTSESIEDVLKMNK